MQGVGTARAVGDTCDAFVNDGWWETARVVEVQVGCFLHQNVVVLIGAWKPGLGVTIHDMLVLDGARWAGILATGGGCQFMPHLGLNLWPSAAALLPSVGWRQEADCGG